MLFHSALNNTVPNDEKETMAPSLLPGAPNREVQQVMPVSV